MEGVSCNQLDVIYYKLFPFSPQLPQSYFIPRPISQLHSPHERRRMHFVSGCLSFVILSLGKKIPLSSSSHHSTPSSISAQHAFPTLTIKISTFWETHCPLPHYLPSHLCRHRHVIVKYFEWRLCGNRRRGYGGYSSVEHFVHHQISIPEALDLLPSVTVFRPVTHPSVTHLIGKAKAHTWFRRRAWPLRQVHAGPLEQASLPLGGGCPHHHGGSRLSAKDKGDEGYLQGHPDLLKNDATKNMEVSRQGWKLLVSNGGSSILVYWFFYFFYFIDCTIWLNIEHVRVFFLFFF